MNNLLNEDGAQLALPISMQVRQTCYSDMLAIERIFRNGSQVRVDHEKQDEEDKRK